MKNLLKEVILKIKSLWNLIISYKSVPRWIKNLRKFEDTIDNNQQSFVFIPHSKESIDSLIVHLNDLKTQF